MTAANSACTTIVERTAYPHFKQHPFALELALLYTLTPEEI